MAAASPPTDELRAAIERAVLGVAAGTITADVAIAAISRATAEKMVTVTPKEQTSASAARLLEKFDDAKARGHARHAAAIVARQFTDCPHEQIQLAARIRRLARNRDAK
jgi:hypothetical protein